MPDSLLKIQRLPRGIQLLGLRPPEEIPQAVFPERGLARLFVGVAQMTQRRAIIFALIGQEVALFPNTNGELGCV